MPTTMKVMAIKRSFPLPFFLASLTLTFIEKYDSSARTKTAVLSVNSRLGTTEKHSRILINQY